MVDEAPRCPDARRDGKLKNRLRHTCRHPYVSADGHGFNSSLPNVVLESITTSGSLKCVRWYNLTTEPKPRHWTAFLRRHPELEFLGNQTVALNTHVKLDTVKILHGHPSRTGQMTLWSTVDLPAVRSLFYDWAYDFEIDNSAESITLSRLGQNLTNIELDVFEERYLPMSRLASAFARIRAECTCLIQVVLGFESWPMLGSYTPTLPSTVHTLSIRVRDAQISVANVKRFFNTHLPSYIACNPSVKTIKFMEAKNIRALRSHPLPLWHGLRAMEKSGVTIKDLEDRLIVPPSCPGVIHLQQLDKPSSISTLDAEV